jgi:hypothetical protein
MRKEEKKKLNDLNWLPKCDDVESFVSAFDFAWIGQCKDHNA